MIRELSNKYLRELVRLNVSALKSIEKKIGKTDSKWLKEYFEFTFKEGKVFGYFIDGELIGCIGYVISHYGSYAEIQHVLVKPKFRGKGIGKELIIFIESYIKKNYPKLKEFHLSVRCQNDHALDFYEKKGYSKRSYIMKKKI